MIGHTQPVFQFLCPLDTLLNEDEHYGGVWGLLSGLAYFLTPGQEDEEVRHICFSSRWRPPRHVGTRFASLMSACHRSCGEQQEIGAGA